MVKIIGQISVRNLSLIYMIKENMLFQIYYHLCSIKYYPTSYYNNVVHHVKFSVNPTNALLRLLVRSFIEKFIRAYKILFSR